MTEPVYTPVLPPRPLRLDEQLLRAYYDTGGEEFLREQVRRELIRKVGPRASCTTDVEALRVYVDLEVEPTTEHYLRRFRAADAATE